MSTSFPSAAWLDRESAKPIPVTGNCSLGRATGNDVVLVDDRVSRRHATIHAQGEQEFLLVDLGSRNGTFLNGRRVNQPTRLRDGDQLQVGPFTLTFHQLAGTDAGNTRSAPAAQTLVELSSVNCWLMLCDIAGSSVLAREKSGEELAMLMGGWFARCKEAIEDSGGAINKYLGDGLLAFWRARPETRPHVAQAVRDLIRMQQSGPPPFRVVIHYGSVVIGGVPSSGEDSLGGPEVNLVFRMERLGSELRVPTLASGAALRQMEGLLAGKSAGAFPLAGFEGEHEMFTLERVV